MYGSAKGIIVTIAIANEFKTKINDIQEILITQDHWLNRLECREIKSILIWH
jgi:hypothetical protein